MCLNPVKIKHPAHKYVGRLCPGLSADEGEYFAIELRARNSPPVMEVPCGRCVECRKRRASDWRVRLLHEFNFDKRCSIPIFVTLTFNNKYYAKFKDNPQSAIRAFADRFRKQYGYSCRYFFVSELGSLADRLHLHGIIFNPPFRRRANPSYKVINRWLQIKWKYGFTWTGFVSDATCNYILKYITKYDSKHPDFFGRIYVSPGLGRSYLDPSTIENLRTHPLGKRLVHAGNRQFSMPRYYYNKIYNEYERQLLTLCRDFLSPPDPLVWRRYVFTDVYAKEQFVRGLYEDSVARGLTLPIYRNVNYSLSPNLNF